MWKINFVKEVTKGIESAKEPRKGKNKQINCKDR